MPAQPLLAALALSEGRATAWRRADADAAGAIAACLASAGQPAPLWREDATKAFVGDKGSRTCAHVDIAPDLELAHGLHGTKLLGVATHEATARLLEDHAPPAAGEGPDDEEDDDDEEEEDDVVATSVPTDRPLRQHEAALLSDPDVSLACVLPGDVCVFASSALHFASNGADELSAALFHGIVTEASMPRLEEAARRGSRGDDAQLSAQDVLREIRGGGDGGGA